MGSRDSVWRETVRIMATAIVSSAITATVLTVLAPEPAITQERPTVVMQEPTLYPVTVGEKPTVTFESHASFVEDYLALKQDLAELRHAIDYDAEHGQAGASVHEWADYREPGTFGGGRKP